MAQLFEVWPVHTAALHDAPTVLCALCALRAQVPAIPALLVLPHRPASSSWTWTVWAATSWHM
jgi:hypothetical protein